MTWLEEGLGRWVVADAMTADMTNLFEAHHTALADWEYAPLTVALLEAAGRGVCWMKEALVVMPTLSSSRLLGITSCLLRQAINCRIPAAALPSAVTSASRSAGVCPQSLTDGQGVYACGRAGDNGPAKGAGGVFCKTCCASLRPFSSSLPAALFSRYVV